MYARFLAKFGFALQRSFAAKEIPTEKLVDKRA